MSYLPNDRCEEALVAVLSPVIGALAVVVTGKASADKDQVPIVICSAEGEGEEDPKGTGNFWLNAVIAIKAPAVPDPDGTGSEQDPKPADQTLVSLVLTTLLVDNLPALLSAAVTDFTVFPNGIIRSAPGRRYEEHGLWVDELPLKIYCCASTLAP